jgi:polyribonucleotide nucleotidyltransferase
MDPAFRPDVIAMIAASSALMLSGVPFDGPVAGLRIGRSNGSFKAFMTPEERGASDLDLVVAGTKSGITMVEAGANEVPEDTIINLLAREKYITLINFITINKSSFVIYYSFTFIKNNFMHFNLLINYSKIC